MGEGIGEVKAALTNPIFVALDVDNADAAMKLVDQTRDFVGGYKVGPRLAVRYGETLLKSVAKQGALFVDNKYFDIPNTMESAVRATFEMGASFCTIHAQCGPEALSLMAKLEGELCKTRPFRILAVTVLTSFKPETLSTVVKDQPIALQVRALAKQAIECGLTGLVCSSEEVEDLRQLFPAAYLVTPGVRLANEDHGDQKRVADPLTALSRGASALVVGRPICEANDPRKAAKTYYEEIQKVR